MYNVRHNDMLHHSMSVDVDAHVKLLYLSTLFLGRWWGWWGKLCFADRDGKCKGRDGVGEMISSCVYSMMSYSPSRYSHYIIMLKISKGTNNNNKNIMSLYVCQVILTNILNVEGQRKHRLWLRSKSLNLEVCKGKTEETGDRWKLLTPDRQKKYVIVNVCIFVVSVPLSPDMSTINQSIKDCLFGTATYNSWREGMSANIPSVIPEMDPLTKLLLEHRKTEIKVWHINIL